MCLSHRDCHCWLKRREGVEQVIKDIRKRDHRFPVYRVLTDKDPRLNVYFASSAAPDFVYCLWGLEFARFVGSDRRKALHFYEDLTKNATENLTSDDMVYRDFSETFHIRNSIPSMATYKNLR